MRTLVLFACLFAFPVQACTQVTFDLFGPESRYSEALEYDSPQWSWPGSALTASTQYIRFDRIGPVEHARLLIVWWPLESAYLRLTQADAGPTNLVVLATLHAANRPSPVGMAADLTADFQQLQTEGVPKYIGYQLYGHARVGVVRLEMCVQ